MSEIDALVTSAQFLSGVRLGVAVAVVLSVGLVVAARTQKRAPRTFGFVGPAAVAGSLLVLTGVEGSQPSVSVPWTASAGFMVLFLCGAAFATRLAPVRPLGCLVGGLLLAASAPSHTPGWELVLLVVGPGLAGAAIADFDRRPAPLVPVLLIVSALGVYATVPDTEVPRAFLGVLLPLAVVAWPMRLGTLGRGGAYAVAGLFCWTAVVEGAGRRSSVPAAVLCLGLLILEPGGRAFAGWAARHHRPVRRLASNHLLVSVAFHVALVSVSARIAGRQHDLLAGLIVLVPLVLVGLLGGSFLSDRDVARPDLPKSGGSVQRRAR
jgi:hypothetical protein